MSIATQDPERATVWRTGGHTGQVVAVKFHGPLCFWLMLFTPNQGVPVQLGSGQFANFVWEGRGIIDSDAINAISLGVTAFKPEAPIFAIVQPDIAAAQLLRNERGMRQQNVGPIGGGVFCHNRSTG